MTDIQCEENGDCFLVESKGNAPSDLIEFTEQKPTFESSKSVSPLRKAKRSIQKKKQARQGIKGRVKTKRVSTKNVVKRNSRKTVVKPKKQKKKTKR